MRVVENRFGFVLFKQCLYQDLVKTPVDSTCTAANTGFPIN